MALSRVKPVPPSCSWMTSEPLDCSQPPLLTSATHPPPATLSGAWHQAGGKSRSLSPHHSGPLPASLTPPGSASPIAFSFSQGQPSPVGHRANGSVPSAPLFLWNSTVGQFNSLLPCWCLKGRDETPLLPKWSPLKFFISNPIGPSELPGTTS